MVQKIYTVRGFTGNLREISIHFGIKLSTLQSRIYAGWSIETAVSTPVDKVKSTRVPIIHNIGKQRLSPSEIENLFGVKLTTSDSVKTSRIIARINKYHNTKFYDVGANYKGTLLAISEDFNCPLTKLKAGVASGITPYDILKADGLLKEKKNECY